MDEVDFTHPLGLAYGLLKNDAGLTEKLGYTAYRVTAQQLMGWDYDQQVIWSNTSVEGHRFKTADARRKIVVWTDTGYPLGATWGPSPITANITCDASFFPGVTRKGRLLITDKYGSTTVTGIPGT